MKVNIIGSILSTSGYSNHIRQLANALSKVTDVKLSTQLIPNWERLVTDSELIMLKKEDNYDRINIIIDLPFNWIQYANKRYNIGFLVFEGDKIPESWIEIIKDNRINQIWTPSTHTYKAIKNTLKDEQYIIQQIMNKVKIVPHGVDFNIFKPQEISKPFTFLVNKGFRNEYDRGGMQYAIRAFIEEFDKGEARLILKVNPAYAMAPNDLINYINRICTETGKNQNIGEIIINYDALPYELLNELYNNCDVLLNPTKAEAFSLPSLEAMACKKPVITTNFGGQTDFVNTNNGWLIPYELKEVKNELMYEGIKQAIPDIASLRKAMREAYSNKDLLSEKSQKVYTASLNWTWSNSAEKAIQALKEL